MQGWAKDIWDQVLWEAYLASVSQDLVMKDRPFLPRGDRDSAIRLSGHQILFPQAACLPVPLNAPHCPQASSRLRARKCKSWVPGVPSIRAVAQVALPLQL